MRSLRRLLPGFALACACAGPAKQQPAAQPSSTLWPHGERAAVTLTYDDGLDSQLALVVPALDAAQLHGTFFVSSIAGVDHDWALPNATDALNERQLAWQRVAGAGHELASHSVHHPCPLELVPGQAQGFRLVDYDLARMAADLDDSVQRLMRLGARPPLTFAYPCESDRFGLGPEHLDYAPLVRERFVAARTSKLGMADPAKVDLLDVPVVDAQGLSAEQLRKQVDEARARGAWLVLLFHGVGEARDCPDLRYRPDDCMLNYLVSSDAAHRELIAYLAAQRADVWTATFGEVARQLRDARGLHDERR
jgi:peptidoglycan/xylan/chitin deacetylase (PgdA/CDA1 family)